MLKRAIEILKEEGIRSFWFQLLGKIGYRRLLLRERLLEEPIPEVKPNLPVTIELLKKTELDEYLKFRIRVDPSLIMDWLNAGHCCFVARYKGQIISACWAATHRAWIYFLAREIRLAPDEVYIYDAFTKSDFRGQSIFPAILAEMVRYFRAAGYRQMTIGVVPENKPSLWAMRKVGFRHFGIVGYIKIGPWRRDFYRTSKMVRSLD
jgi:GNAT superfamily N-acetyltransferase